MFQQTLVQLQILLTMAPGLAIWLLITPSAQPFLVQALTGNVGQVVCLSQPMQMHRDGRHYTIARSSKRSRIASPLSRSLPVCMQTLAALAGSVCSVTRSISFPHAARAP
ncbi:MAG: hypothetical protein ABIY70_24585 [Capsulimonas sp.]|uniref:hypothetical protein n=1 Tax=Capsulimonas sp. TaxID=2494211 RepID=UPI0032635A2C